MAPRKTRKSTAAAANAKKKKDEEPTPTLPPVEIKDTGNPKIFILPTSNPSPSSQSQSAIITLSHPSTSTSTRYLLHSSQGLHEIKKFTSPITVPRSWLVTPIDETLPGPDSQSPSADNGWIGKGQTVPDSSIYICTPIDPLFLLLKQLTSKTHYLPIDDFTEGLIEESKHWNKILEAGSPSEKMVKARIKAVCDMVDAGGEMSYRLNKTKLWKVLVGKCEKMAEGDGFPRSMEEEFVKKILARPLTEVSSLNPVVEEEKENINSEKTKEDSTDSSNKDSSETKPIPATASSSPSIPPEISHLLRLRLSVQILSTYLSPTLSTELSSHLATIHDFTPLETYLADLAKLKQELALTRAGNYSMQRGVEEEEQAIDRRKRKRKEEEEEKKRKKNTGTAIKMLAKVNTTGMAKMTMFFKKKE